MSVLTSVKAQLTIEIKRARTPQIKDELEKRVAKIDKNAANGLRTLTPTELVAYSRDVLTEIYMIKEKDRIREVIDQTVKEYKSKAETKKRAEAAIAEYMKETKESDALDMFRIIGPGNGITPEMALTPIGPGNGISPQMTYKIIN